MSKFESEQEQKVRQSIFNILYNYRQVLDPENISESIMLRIRPYLKVQKKWIGDAL